MGKSALRKLPINLQEHKVTEQFVLAGLATPTDDEKEAKVSLHCSENAGHCTAVLRTYVR